MEERLWEQFQQTGAVADYLQYAAKKGSKTLADSEGCCPGTETCRGT